MNTSQDGVTALQAAIDGLEIRDEQDLLAWIPLASRLAVLGERSRIRRWSEVSAPYREDLARLLEERAAEGIHGIESATGSFLADELIDAQDFRCFLHLAEAADPSGPTLDPSAVRSLKLWALCAEGAALDDEAIGDVGLFFERFPIPTDMRLSSMVEPASTDELAMLCAMHPEPDIVELEWPRGDELADIDLESAVGTLQYASSDSAPEELREAFERRRVTFELSDRHRGALSITRRLEASWMVQIIIRLENSNLGDIEAARIGSMPMQADSGDRDCWQCSLAGFPTDFRERALQEPLVLSFSSGVRVAFRESEG